MITERWRFQEGYSYFYKDLGNKLCGAYDYLGTTPRTGDIFGAKHRKFTLMEHRMSVLTFSRERFRKCVWALITVCFCCLFLNLKTAVAQDTITREFQIKAVFLYNFTEFVRWPQEAFDSLDSPLVIGILGHDPFGVLLDETVKDESRDGHSLIVQRFQSPNDIKDCHVLFISMDSKAQLTSALAAVRTKPILTVSDMDGFIKAGGMIRFHNEDGRVSLQINAAAVQERGLIISSKLLRLAEVIPDENN